MDPTDLYRLLMTGEVAGSVTGTGADITPAGAPVSQFGLIMFDRESFLNNWNNIDSQVDPKGAGGYAAGERAEESWLDQNSVPLMINRYNGTLLRGE